MSRRILSALVMAIAATAIIIVATAGPSSGAANESGFGGFPIEVVNGGDGCLTTTQPVQGGYVSVAGCTNKSPQAWTRMDLPQGGFAIRTIGTSNTCIDIQWGGTADGTPIWMWPCNQGGAQQWVWQAKGFTGQLMNPQSGKCLDKALNGNLVLWTCHDSTAWWQQWRFW